MATPDSLLRQLDVLFRRAERLNFADFDAPALFDAATKGDEERFRTLRKDAYVAMARAVWPEFVAQMRAASHQRLASLDPEPRDATGEKNV